MKKFLTIALASCFALTGCFALGACDDGSGSGSGSGGGSGSYDHKIVFYTSQGQELVPITQTAIETFQEKYPGWEVEHIQCGGYPDVLNKVRSDLTAGIQPDLAYCYADHVAQYIDSGTIVDMSKYLENAESYTYTIGEESKTIDRIGFTEEDVDSFIPGYLEEGYARNFTDEKAHFSPDALLTLPFVKSTEALYYNPTALKTLGYDEPPTTWDELWEICEKARAEWPTCTPLGYDSEANWFITMSQQRDFGYTSVDPNNHFLFNNDGAKAWLTELAEYYNKGYITTQQIYGSYTSALFVNGPEKGGLVFCIGSTGGAKNQAGNGFTTEVAPIPGTDATHMQCISQGPSLVMLRGGNNPTDPDEKEIMTFQFIKELLSVSFQAKFSRGSGYAPMRTDVYDNEDFQYFVDGLEEDGETRLTGTDLIISKCVKASSNDEFNKRLFTSPAFVGSSTARDQMTSVVQYVLLGQKTPERALADAYKNCGGK